MREIKFRAWYNNTMYDQTDIVCTRGISNQFYEFFAQGTSATRQINITAVFMQFIGLKDDNEKEVYDGDILKVSQIDDFSGKETITIDYIRYFEKIASFRLAKNPQYLFFNYADEFEVIGNIHSNPELL